MELVLAQEQQRFVASLVHSGRFRSENEVVNEALRQMATNDLDYLNPPPLTEAEIECIYGDNAEEEEREARIGYAAFAAIRRAAQRGAAL